MPNSSGQSASSLTEPSEAGLAGEFFSYDASAAAIASVEEFRDTEEVIDERRVRSMSPEVAARRARYQVLVFRLIVAMVVLILAAVALRLLRR
jgi:cytochrome c-type biogenesis protein CcmH/NrfG